MSRHRWMRIALAGLLAGLFAAGGAQAALIGVTQTFPDVSFTSVYLAYDHDGVSANTGLLRVVANTSTLNEGAAAGGSTQLQSYLAAGDSIPDVMLSFQVRNGTGGFTAGTLVGGSVSIGFGNAAASPRFSWTGTVNQFGWATGIGTIFDATWSVGADQYQNLSAANFPQFVNGFLSGGSGALKLTSSASWGAGANFSNDWVFGINPASNTNLNDYRAEMTSPVQTNSTITADVWASPAAVPLPAGLWILGSGLLALAPAVRRRRRTGA